jgi:hypothetical protein
MSSSAKTTLVKPSRRKASKAAPGAPIVSPGQATQDAEIFALVAQIKAAQARWSAACAARDERMARFEMEFPKPDSENPTFDAWVEEIWKPKEERTKSEEERKKLGDEGIALLIKRRPEKDRWQEAEKKVREEAYIPICEAIKERESLIKNLIPLQAATFHGVSAKASVVNWDISEGRNEGEIDLTKSIFADIQALSA